MRYKVGDTVEIKTFEKIKKEYNQFGEYDVELPEGRVYTKNMEKFAQSLSFRMATINETEEADNEIVYESYKFKGSNNFWDDRLIECEVKLDPIQSRFEILDL